MKIHVSKGNTKMGNIPSISFPPVITCRNCEGCSEKCYAKKSYRMYPSVKKAWDENYAYYRADAYNYFKDLQDWITKNKPEYFRFNVSGDIVDYVELHMIENLARYCPDTKFLLFSKAYNLVNHWYLTRDSKRAPKNLTVRLSGWYDQTIMSSFGLPEAHITSKDGLKTSYNGRAKVFHCKGSCIDCKVCWDKFVPIVMFTEH